MIHLGQPALQRGTKRWILGIQKCAATNARRCPNRCCVPTCVLHSLGPGALDSTTVLVLWFLRGVSMGHHGTYVSSRYSRWVICASNLASPARVVFPKSRGLSRPCWGISSMWPAVWARMNVQKASIMSATYSFSWCLPNL